MLQEIFLIPFVFLLNFFQSSNFKKKICIATIVFVSTNMFRKANFFLTLLKYQIFFHFKRNVLLLKLCWQEEKKSRVSILGNYLNIPFFFNSIRLR